MGFRAVRFVVTVAILALLAASLPSAGWHNEDERQNQQFGSSAGDPRVLEDAAECISETTPVPDVHCITLYSHTFDLLNPAPMNTQRPAECAPDLAKGFSTAPNVEPYWSFARQDWYVSPGFVQYPDDGDSGTCDEPRLFPARSQAGDMELSQDFDIRATIHLSADALEVSALGIGTGEDSLTPSLGAMPCLSVRVAMETGRYMGDGEVLAEGVTTKTVVSTPYGWELGQMPLVPDPCPGSTGTITAEEVTRFGVNMGPARQATIPQTEVFAFHVQWYQHNGTSMDPGNEDNAGQNDWNLHTGSRYPNRVVLPVKNPVEIRTLQVLHESDTERWEEIRNRENRAVQDGLEQADHRIHLVSHTPWGNYDLDTANIRIQVLDDAGEPVHLEHIGGPIDITLWAHDTYNAPRNLTFPWNLYAEDMEAGTYTLRAIVPNWQHMAHGEKEIRFQVGDPAEYEPAPASGAALLLFAPLALGLAVIRRRTR